MAMTPTKVIPIPTRNRGVLYALRNTAPAERPTSGKQVDQVVGAAEPR